MIEFAAGMGLAQALNLFGAQQAAFASNAAINAQNNANLLGAWGQGQTNALNEKLTREAWAREDKAVQRRVADLKAAGLSPVLAAGSAAQSSGAIPMGSFRPESAGNLKMQKAQMAVQMIQNVAQTISGTMAAYHQVRMMDAQATSAEARSALADAFAQSELEEMRQRTESSKASARITNVEAEYMEGTKKRMSSGGLAEDILDVARVLVGENKEANTLFGKLKKGIVGPEPTPEQKEKWKREHEERKRKAKEAEKSRSPFAPWVQELFK